MTRKNGDSEKPDIKKIFGLDAGIGGGYSYGASVSNFFYKPFANLYLKHQYVKFTAGLTRHQNHLIPGGDGKFETVNFSQPKAAISLYPHKIIELYGDYRFSTGDPSHYFRAHDVTAGFLLDFTVVSLDAAFNKKLTEYRFKSVDWLSKIALLAGDIATNGQVTQYYLLVPNYNKQIDDISTTVTLSWNVIDTTSIDATYHFLHSAFKEPKDSYYIHTARFGVYSDVWKHITLHGGVSLGFDAEKYIIAGGDLGVIGKILDYVTLSATYLPSYYAAPKTNTLLNKFIELYALNYFNYNITASNPYLQTSMIGKSFLNQNFIFSVNYKY